MIGAELYYLVKKLQEMVNFMEKSRTYRIPRNFRGDITGSIAIGSS